eukprot:4876068-Prymnesium_polylepis.1
MTGSCIGSLIFGRRYGWMVALLVDMMTRRPRDASQPREGRLRGQHRPQRHAGSESVWANLDGFISTIHVLSRTLCAAVGATHYATSTSTARLNGRAAH